jgi:GH24 family phage-related lysozyme (muramidase)
VVKYSPSCSHSTNIFLIASIVFLTVGSGFLARAGMHYSDAVEDDAISKEVAACPGCVSSDQILDAYAESIRSKMQDSLQDMIFNAGIGIALFSMGAGFSMVYVKYYRNVQPIL